LSMARSATFQSMREEVVVMASIPLDVGEPPIRLARGVDKRTQDELRNRIRAGFV